MKKAILLTCLVIVMLITGCGPSSETLETTVIAQTNQASPPTRTAIPTSTPMPASTFTPIPTNTSALATDDGKDATSVVLGDELVGEFEFLPTLGIETDKVAIDQMIANLLDNDPLDPCPVVHTVEEVVDVINPTYLVFISAVPEDFFLVVVHTINEDSEPYGSALFGTILEGESGNVVVIAEYPVPEGQLSPSEFEIQVIAPGCDIFTETVSYGNASISPAASPFAGAWHRLNVTDSVGTHQVIDCQEDSEMWTCKQNNHPEPDLGFDYSSTFSGVFEGVSIPNWICPNWFPERICKNAISVIGGKTLYTEGEGPGLEVDIEYIVVETGSGQILYEYWVNRFACPWYRTFDDALAANPYPYIVRDCLQAK